MEIPTVENNRQETYFVKKTTSIEPPDPCNSKQFMDEQTFYLSSIQIDKDIQIFHYKSVQEFVRFGMK